MMIAYVEKMVEIDGHIVVFCVAKDGHCLRLEIS
jgi:hypothetical protein